MAKKKTKSKTKTATGKKQATPTAKIIAKKPIQIQPHKPAGKGLGIVIVGSQWGDEGKGKIVDVLSERVDLVVRYQGGNNAGHTVVVGERKFKLHTLPSGVVRGKRSLVGAGVVVDLRDLMRELMELEKTGVSVDEKVLGIDARCQLIMPWHNLLDASSEGRAENGNKIGTTMRGIGPAYEDRAGRRGIRFEDLLSEEELKQKIRRLAVEKILVAKALGASDADIRFTPESVAQEYSVLSRMFAKYLCDVSSEVNDALASGKRVLFEGAQGTLLDNDFGTYPFVTSSHPIAGGVCSGVGAAASSINRVEAIVKAYTTRVGEGPFPTELTEDTGKRIREKGGEFGTTTGRPRRTGWLDVPLLRYANSLNGFTSLHITKLDVLGGMPELKICTGYDVNGKKAEKAPVLQKELSVAKPVYETMPGFENKSREEWMAVAKEGNKKGLDALPANAKKYVEKVQELLGVPVISVSVGPDRQAIIELKGFLK